MPSFSISNTIDQIIQGQQLPALCTCPNYGQRNEVELSAHLKIASVYAFLGFGQFSGTLLPKYLQCNV